MRKSQLVRIAGFTVALGTTASLAGFAATGTGAYFSDSKAGNINVTTGAVTVATNDISGLDFTGLLPEQFKTQPVSYRATGTGPEDIYLAFNSTADAAINGDAAPGANPLGRYGHLEVDGPAGSFDSFNLAANPDNKGDASCGVNGNGLGGSNQEATSHNNADPNSYVPYCPAPQYILLSSGLKSTDGLQSANITFGYTKLLESGQSSGLSQIPFNIVAEQAGVSPSDPNTANAPAN
jgi:hypothetical protein